MNTNVFACMYHKTKNGQKDTFSAERGFSAFTEEFKKIELKSPN